MAMEIPNKDEVLSYYGEITTDRLFPPGRVFQLEYWCHHLITCEDCETLSISTCDLDLDAHNVYVVKNYGLDGFV